MQTTLKLTLAKIATLVLSVAAAAADERSDGFCDDRDRSLEPGEDPCAT